MMMDERQLQHEYYARTARRYESMHMSRDDEHFFALSLLIGVIDFLEATSVLDVGCGTGRVLTYVKKMRPAVSVLGIEPVSEMRAVGHERGLSREELVSGTAEALEFPSRSFDVVCAFGVLHHLRRPEVAIAEMLRVGRQAIFISDSNNFGQGSLPSRIAKQALNALRLWPVVNFLKTKGRGYDYSAGDGVSYSYSVFNNYPQIRQAAKAVHIVNTSQDGGASAYRSASHVAVIGLL